MSFSGDRPSPRCIPREFEQPTTNRVPNGSPNKHNGEFVEYGIVRYRIEHI